MNSLNYLFKALPWLGLFAAITIAWIFFLKARNKERITMIEKGVDPTQIFATPQEPFQFPWLKLGIIIFGISIGLALILLLIVLFPESELAHIGGVALLVGGFLFGGLSMIIANFVDKSKR